MAIAHSTIHYMLSRREDVDQLLTDLGQINAQQIVIAFDEHRDLEPTDLDLARIAAAARDHQKQLILESSNQGLSQRARGFGFQETALPNNVLESGANDEATNALTNVDGGDAPSRSNDYETTASLATYRPSMSQSGKPLALGEATVRINNPRIAVIPASQGNDDDDSAAASDSNGSDELTAVISAHQRQQSRPQPVRQPRRARAAAGTAATAQAAVPYHPGNVHDPEDEPPIGAEAAAPRRKPTRKRRKTLLIALAVVAPVLVLALAGALALYYLPSASVQVVPVEESISSSLTYGVNVDGVSYDVMVDPVPISHSIAAESRHEATGERFEPDGTASGQIQITNPHTSDVTVPAGTELSGPNGIPYYTSNDVTIPAADPFGSQAFGAETVGVYAGVAGPDGNIGAGTLTGQLGNGLFYTNNGGIGGGSMRSISVIEEADVEAVRSDIGQQLTGRAEEAFMQAIPDGFKLVPDSIEIGEPEIEINGEPRADGTEVTGQGQISIRGQVYDPDALHELAREETGRTLASQGGNQRILLANSVSIGEPTPLSNDETAFVVYADATVRTVVTVEEQEAILNDLVGKNRSDAERILQEHAKIDQFSLTLEPEWLPERMPEIASRIDIHVSSGEQTTATR